MKLFDPDGDSKPGRKASAPPRGSRTWELSVADWRRPVSVAAKLSLGDTVYAPNDCNMQVNSRALQPDAGTRAYEPDVTGEHPQRQPTHHMAGLRLALRHRGLELQDMRCFYWRVVRGPKPCNVTVDHKVPIFAPDAHSKRVSPSPRQKSP